MAVLHLAHKKSVDSDPVITPYKENAYLLNFSKFQMSIIVISLDNSSHNLKTLIPNLKLYTPTPPHGLMKTTKLESGLA